MAEIHRIQGHAGERVGSNTREMPRAQVKRTCAHARAIEQGASSYMARHAVQLTTTSGLYVATGCWVADQVHFGRRRKGRKHTRWEGVQLVV